MPKCQHWHLWHNVFSDEGVKELKKLLLLSCGNNTADYMTLLDTDTIDVIDILECWYELKLEEAKQYEKDKPKKALNGQDMLEMGMPLEVLLEGLEDE